MSAAMVIFSFKLLLAGLLLAQAVVVPSGPGVIKDVQVSPPGCKLDPPTFVPDNQFSVVECPQVASTITLSFSSVFHLVDGAQRELPDPLQLHLAEGEARDVTVQACGGGSDHTGGFKACTTYEFDVHRAGSDQAALAELLVTCGAMDAEVTPAFDAAVTNYEASVPFETTVMISAGAAKGGFVSFTSFAAAEHHRVEEEIVMTPEEAAHIVDIYVVSAERQGQTKYQIVLRQQASTDAGLEAIRSNVGHVKAVGAEGSNEFMLTVPAGTKEVAVSATARDKKGAIVKVEDTSGPGYASTVIAMHEGAPYELVHVDVRAADRSTVAEYILVVLTQNMATTAMLASLVVPGCVDGMKPPFRVSEHHYRCALDQLAEQLEVKPTTMWMLAGQGHMSLRIDDKAWQSGATWKQPLDKFGHAQVSVEVSSADGHSKAVYVVTADGYPEGMRGPLYSTRYPTIRPTSTVASTSSPGTSSPVKGNIGEMYFATTTVTVTMTGTGGYDFPKLPSGATFDLPTRFPTTTTLTTTLPPEVPTITTTTSTTTPAKPLWVIVRQHMPKLSKGAIHRGMFALDVAVVSSCVLALLSSKTLANGLHLLKQVQFVALTMGLVAPTSLYAHLAVPFGVFNLWVFLPDIRLRPRRSLSYGAGAAGAGREGRRLAFEEGPEEGEEEGEEDGEEQARRDADMFAGGAVLVAAALPIVAIAFFVGWFYASAEEDMASRNLLHDMGAWAPRAKLLPCALVLLDAGLLGFTNSVAALLLGPPADVHVGRHILGQGLFQFLLVVYPVAYSAFGLVQLCRLRREGRLVWSPVLQRFSDSRSLAVTLRGPSFSAASTSGRGPPLLRWLYSEEVQNIVPLEDPEGGPLRLVDETQGSATTPDGFLFDEQAPPPLAVEELMQFGGASEIEAGLLPSKARRVADWQKHQERLGILLWIERRCATYEALKHQISEVGRSEQITDSQGQLIYDSRGQCLADLYQYCIYQFPSRPWYASSTKWSSCSIYQRGAEFDPVDFAGGVLAPWVPPVESITAVERRVVDAWLDRWLHEAETVAKTREMLLQLRWRGYDARAMEDQAALLQEMALAVLLGQEMQMPKEFSRDEHEEREARLAQLSTDRRRCGMPLPWQEEVDKPGSHESLAMLHIDLITSDDFWPTLAIMQHPLLRSAAFALKRFHLRTSGRVPAAEEEEGEGRAARRDAVQSARSRVTLASCELPVRYLRLFAGWVPAFGVAVPHASLALPIVERWSPLFATCAAPGAPGGAYLLDVIDRALAVSAILAARWLMTAGRPILSAASLALWRGVYLGMLLLSGVADKESRLSGAVVMQIFLCSTIAMCNGGLEQLQGEVLDRFCACGVIVVVFALGWRGLLEVLCSCCSRRRANTFRVLALSGSSDEDTGIPRPPFGEYRAVDCGADARPLALAVAVPFLGLVLPAEAMRESCVTTDERRAACARKRLVVYERAVAPAGYGPPRTATKVKALARYRAEIRDMLPVVFTREQLAGAEEVRELACTIHVVNHEGFEWSSIRHDSVLSLYKPWGLDNRTPGKAARDNASAASETERRERYRQSADSPALVKAWRDEVVNWLYGELAASGSVEHTAQDMMLNAGSSKREEFKREGDRRVVPGIFSDDGLGSNRYSDSRCFKEGRVLHYVIFSSELKSSITWRPDPLAAHPADLLCGDRWRPCLLRLASRSLSYSLRKRDGIECGGSCPQWKEPVYRDLGDVVEYNVAFFFLDRVAVDVDQGLITLHERDRSMPAAQTVARPDYAPRCLPMVFRVDLQSARIWDSVAKTYRMSSRPEHIVNYVGQVREHPRLPGVSCRQGPEGEQLWDDGSRYVGSWEAHVYHGQGQLVDTTGSLIYKGQWAWGAKHGEGTYFFTQEGTKRAYAGQWVRDEFKGKGELWVLDEALDEVRRSRPFAVVRYQGQFEVAEGQFPRPLDLTKLEMEKHATLIKAHFPTRPAPPSTKDAAVAAAAAGTTAARPVGSSSLLTGDGPALQFGGAAPKDNAQEYYSLDGADVRHCGPDEACEISYADGTHYTGPCLSAAIPHGANGLLIEPNGTQYEGGFDRGLRAGPATLTLACGVVYHGEFAQPGGQRHGKGSLQIPEESLLRTKLGFVSYVGQYWRGLREGEGELTFLDGSVYTGSFKGNRRHGQGSLKEANGTIYTGPWEDDKPGTGKGEIRYISGHRYVGDLSSCQRQGEGKIFHPKEGSDWVLLYAGQWDKDEMHGRGELHNADGVYNGLMVNGVRSGLGKFAYSKPEVGSQLPVAPSSRQPGELSKPRSYEGQWESDQPHGKGTYLDEYGYKNEGAIFASGRLSSDRRPPLRGCKEKWFNNPKWPGEDKFAKTFVEPSPQYLPRSRDLCKSRGMLPPAEPLAVKSLDVGSGYAHARVRPAHMGLEGVPGTRWA